MTALAATGVRMSALLTVITDSRRCLATRSLSALPCNQLSWRLGLYVQAFVMVAALMLAQGARALESPALTGTVSSAVEGRMEGIVVIATPDSGAHRVAVTTDAEGHFSFPADRLSPDQAHRIE